MCIFCIVTLEPLSTFCVNFHFLFLIYIFIVDNISIWMYIMCVILCLLSALSRRVGALQISIIIIIILLSFFVVVIFGCYFFLPWADIRCLPANFDAMSNVVFNTLLKLSPILRRALAAMPVDRCTQVKGCSFSVVTNYAGRVRRKGAGKRGMVCVLLKDVDCLQCLNYRFRCTYGGKSTLVQHLSCNQFSVFDGHFH